MTCERTLPAIRPTRNVVLDPQTFARFPLHFVPWPSKINRERLDNSAIWIEGLSAMLSSHFLCVLAVLSIGQAAEKRSPVPTPEDQQSAAKLGKELFKAEYLKSKASDRLAFADTMWELAKKTKDDMPSRYFLFTEARDQAGKGGDLKKSFQIGTELSAAFDVPPWEARLPGAEAMVAFAKSGEGRDNVLFLLRSAEYAVEDEEYQVAKKLVGLAGQWERKMSVAGLTTVTASYTKWIGPIVDEYEKAKPAFAKLKTAPTDPDANATAGRFVWLVQQDWPRASAMFRKGTPAEFKSAFAFDEKTEKGTPDDALAAADAWYDSAKKENAKLATAIHARAATLYEKALPGIKALSKNRAKERLAECTKTATPALDATTKWATIKAAVKDKKYHKWDYIDGGFGTNQTFSEIPPEGGILIGFFATASNVIESVQPIYMGSKGEFRGAPRGGGNGTGKLIKAKPGYAVGAIKMQPGGNWDAFQPVFMRIKNLGVDPSDSYVGPHIGGQGGGRILYGGDGNFIVGIHGRAHGGGNPSAMGIYSLERLDVLGAPAFSAKSPSRFHELSLAGVANASCGRPGRSHPNMVLETWGKLDVHGVPFRLDETESEWVPNVLVMPSPNDAERNIVPKAVRIPCRTVAKTIHLLGGSSAWGALAVGAKNLCLTVRLHYEDGSQEDHKMFDGEHFADWGSQAPPDLPKAKLALRTKNGIIRSVTISPTRSLRIESIEFIKGPEPDRSGPMIYAVTVERS